jgi:hypothetical protein
MAEKLAAIRHAGSLALVASTEAADSTVVAVAADIIANFNSTVAVVLTRYRSHL